MKFPRDGKISSLSCCGVGIYAFEKDVPLTINDFYFILKNGDIGERHANNMKCKIHHSHNIKQPL